MLTLFTLPASVGLKVRRIAWEHCNFDQDLGRRARRVARRLAVRSCNAVVVLTQRDRDKWVLALGARNVVVIPNALPFPMPEKPAERRCKTALAVGRLTYAKGFDVLLRAWALVAREAPDWRLDIVGDGEQHAELDALRHGLGLAHCVRLLPARGDLEQMYRSASLFCLSSRYEGFGLVLIEAMAYGLPVVSTDCETGPRDLLAEADLAEKAPVDDYQGLASAILTVLRAPDRQAVLSARAYEAAKRFDVGLAGGHWTALISGAVGMDVGR